MGKKRNKSSFEMYENLINMSNNKLNSGTKFNEDEIETFIFGSEIEERQDKLDTGEKLSSKKEIPIDTNVHFKRFRNTRVHKYTEYELEQIRESCKRTIVHDYGENDHYHFSEEKRIRLNPFPQEIADKLAGIRSIYAKVDQYIYAMRIVYQAWEILAKENYLHSREEFFKLVGKGKIYSTRIIMPKLRKMNQYNLDLIIHYISNPDLDPSDLVMKEIDYDDDDFFDEETEIEKMKRLFSLEELEMMEQKTPVDNIRIQSMNEKFIKGYHNRNVKSNKKRKNENKHERYSKDHLSILLNKIQNSKMYQDQYGFSFMATNNIFEPEKESKSVFDKVRFDGNWADDDAVELYELILHEEMLKEYPAGERYRTYGDLELNEIWKTMEAHGMNVTEFRRRIGESDERETRRIIAREKKENKIKESQIIQRITKLNNDEKFKKIIKKTEKALNEEISDGS